ncbi:protein kinase [Microbacterium sp. W4I20]|uniref:protein kinase domain-containing protein n=1 Tax=Microbacterium sp. W4I20 TaxID=3042262 RepID=UPI00277DA90D|nr:protein kinase [Microbacterium sp. W4I20]MDQ0727473.1 serine/threonine protein kinase [Microbacterium sp. W4I20]
MAILGDSARIKDFQPAAYSFLRTIQEGNTGVTRLYRHTVFGKLFVQKTVSMLGMPNAVATNEPKLLEDLQHQRLIRVRDAQWDADYPATTKALTFVTDYYEGESIHAALQDGHQFAAKAALDIAACILEGLAYLHATKRYVHGDIKPGNIMLNGPRTEGFVGDFGSAAALDPVKGTAAAAGGTLLYRPPEYASGEVDERADLYSTGLTLFEMLNGPLDYDALANASLDRRASEGKPAIGASHLSFRPWVGPAVASFVRKLMHADLAKRFQTADEALRALHKLTYVNWAKVGDGEWCGVWPPRERAARQRLLKVTAADLGGRNAGYQQLSASWSRDGGNTWRGYARFARRTAVGDDAALAEFFRLVEEEAQSVAVR